MLAHSAVVRKRFYLAGITLLLVLIGLGVWNGMRIREPEYKGKPLSYWLERGNCTPAETEDAVDQIGTNCIPTLLRMIQARDSVVKKAFAVLLRRQPLVTIRMRTAFEARVTGLHGFYLLGGRAQPAVGSLIKLYEESPEDSQGIDREALDDIGPAAKEAIPTLMRGMTNANLVLRFDNALVLLKIGADPKLIVPPFAKDLTSSEGRRRNLAANFLGAIWSNAALAVPALIASAKDPDGDFRSRVIEALGKTGGDPQLVVPVLTGALSDTDSDVRESAMNGLAEFETNSASAVPLLITFLADTNDLIRDRTISTLAKIHSRPELTMPVLIDALTNSEISDFAIWGLANFGSEATSAVPALIDYYHREQKGVPEKSLLKVNPLELIRNALIKIDPVATAKAGISTNSPTIPTNPYSYDRNPD